MTASAARARLRDAAPDLSHRIDILVGRWLSRLLETLSRPGDAGFRSKQINDPIWGTIELYAWEVALLDTGLLQRLRGVRQLGLAHLVFPGANHDRLEHIIGVVGAVEVTLQALARQIDRWNRDNRDKPLPQITDADRYALRLAALFHDLGHGPFSHALEPVLEPEAILKPSGTGGSEGLGWRGDLVALKAAMGELYQFNESPSPSELIAAMIVLSDPVREVLGNRKILLPDGTDPEQLQIRIAAAIIGAVEGPGSDHLASIISGQIDADKLDYLQRDAHHAGLEIGFDINRLLSRLELLRVRPENIDASMQGVRERVNRAPEQTLHQIGIAASGFGSFEQMLIGRTFLYDRLYHHHKVRAAEAMAQRLILVAERDRDVRFEFEDLFLDFGDEVVLRLFAGDVSNARLDNIPEGAKGLARGLLDRNLLHRAFALRGRFIGVAPDVDGERADLKRRTLWGRIVKDLSTLKLRYELGAEIHALAVRCATALIDAGIEVKPMTAMRDQLTAIGPEQIIVDLPGLKANAIRILARYPNGSLRVPEFSFNPVKWSNAYELQKRTSYVFCPRDVVPLIALAAKIEFFGRYGVVMAKEADGYIKAEHTLAPTWVDALLVAGILDEKAKEYLTVKRLSLMVVEEVDLRVPQEWLKVDEDFGVRLARELNLHLTGGLAPEHLKELGVVLEAMWALVDHWHGGDNVTAPLADEAALQAEVRKLLEMRDIKIIEGAKASGGLLDLLLNDAVVLENKFEGATGSPEQAKAPAGMQGRRYAIALDSQIVLVVLAYQPGAQPVRAKTKSVTVHPVVTEEGGHVEIRFALPYGASVPSREKAAPARRTRSRS